jgi:Transposase DDE domain group 1
MFKNVINNVEFNAKNLTTYAGVLPLLNFAEDSGILKDFAEILQFGKESTNKIKDNHILTLLCGGFVGIDKLDRFEQMRADPIFGTLGINIRTPENISRFLQCFGFEQTQQVRDIVFKTCKMLIEKALLRNITIDMDSRCVNSEGNQEGAVKGYNPERKGNNCYNIQMAFCDELKCFVSGFMRSGDTYTSNGAAELVKEIIENIKDTVDVITFRMDSGYFSEEIIKIIENAGHKYIIKAKQYSNILDVLYNSASDFIDVTETTTGAVSRTKLNSWTKDRMFVIIRELKPEKDIQQISFDEKNNYEHFIFVSNLNLDLREHHTTYNRRGNAENYIKETKYDMNIGSVKMKSFWASEAYFQIMMVVYNIFLLFKMEFLGKNEYREQIKTFRLKYIFVSGKIIRTGRQTILQLQKDYFYKEVFKLAVA